MPLAEAYKGYARTMWDRLSALATWQPDVPLAVGDVVTAGPGGVVARETTLARLGVREGPLAHSRHTASPVREHSGVTVTASGTAVVTSAGKARASFASQSSFLVVTGQGWLDAADSIAEARAVVEDLAARELWGPGWHLVTSVRTYPACTIVIARNVGTEAEVTVDLSAAGVPVPESIQAGAHVGVNSDYASHWVMPFDSTPLYEAIGMKRRGLRRRPAANLTDHLARAVGGAAATEPAAEEGVMWVAQRTSPVDLGLL